MNTTYAIASIRTRVFAIRRDLLQGYIVPTDQRFLPTGGNDIEVAQ